MSAQINLATINKTPLYSSQRTHHRCNGSSLTQLKHCHALVVRTGNKSSENAPCVLCYICLMKNYEISMHLYFAKWKCLTCFPSVV